MQKGLLTIPSMERPVIKVVYKAYIGLHHSRVGERWYTAVFPVDYSLPHTSFEYFNVAEDFSPSFWVRNDYVPLNDLVSRVEYEAEAISQGYQVNLHIYRIRDELMGQMRQSDEPRLRNWEWAIADVQGEAIPTAFCQDMLMEYFEKEQGLVFPDVEFTTLGGWRFI